MPWFKVDDHLHASRKAAKAGVAAMGLWVLAGSWSAAEELDGFVPSYMVVRLGASQDAADALVLAGLWVLDEHDGENGFRFHQWGEYQPTRAQLEAKREEARARMKRVRERSDSVRANGARSSRSVTPTPTRPDPKKKTPAADAAEFDAFWQLYPRKIGKAAATKAYAKARKEVDAATITAGLSNAIDVWTAAQTEERFIPHASTWLNAARWADEQATLPGVAVAERVTANQCPDSGAHERHPWSEGRNRFMCAGVSW